MWLYMVEYRKRERLAIRKMRLQGFSTRIGGLARSLLNSLRGLAFLRRKRKVVQIRQVVDGRKNMKI